MNVYKTDFRILFHGLILGLVLLGVDHGFSQTLQTLYVFGAQPPSNPAGGVVQGPDGNFYGTTYEGGAFANGAIFRLGTNGVLTDLVDFNGTNGAYPYAGLLSDTNGNFYGTTEHGGTFGYGVVFQVTTNGDLTVLTNLYPAIGSNPQANLIWGSDGKLYGTTVYGGANNDGTVFQVTTDGVFTTFVSFAGTNGANPAASLFLARDGNFYGTTEYGGPNSFGTVFQLTPGGSLTDLGAFDFVNNGLFPVSSLVEDTAGNLYGTSTLGGGGGTGSGALFEIPATNNQVLLGVVAFSSSPNSGMVAGTNNVFYGATQGTLYRFIPTNATLQTIATFAGANGLDATATPMVDASGNLFGTTYDGGANGYGAVYEFDTESNLTALYSFNASSGSQPMGGLVQDARSTLYGTTYNGGSSDNGTAFSLATNGTFKVLVTFNSANGAYPGGSLFLGTNGDLFGTTEGGGGNGSGGGTVFEMSTNGQDFSTLAVFNPTQGAEPVDGLIHDASGNFYGTTYYGGAYNYGAVFKLDTNDVITTLASFDQTNGAWPNCDLTLDNAGYLWGTTVGGGTGSYGTIFKISTNGIPANTFLIPFVTFNGADGSIPSAGLTPGPDGAYYGTTEAGGKYNYGVVFRVSADGIITNMLSFAGGNGAYPLAALIPGTNGDFYGTTAGAGFDHTQFASNGTIFRVTTNGVLTTLFAFNGTNGSVPSAPLLFGQDGALYGTTAYGSTNGSGTIFKLLPGPVNPLPLNIQLSGGNSVLTWTNPVFNLQAAPAAAGPFTNVPEAYSPYTNFSGTSTIFFRLQADTNSLF